jgi:hypothetical protein
VSTHQPADPNADASRGPAPSFPSCEVVFLNERQGAKRATWRKGVTFGKPASGDGDTPAPHLVLEMGVPAPGITARRANDILRLTRAHMNASAVVPACDARVEQAVGELMDYVLSGTAAASDDMRLLVWQADRDAQADASWMQAWHREHPGVSLDSVEGRLAVISRFVVRPGWPEWTRCWARDFGLIMARELPVAFAARLVQSLAASGFQKLLLRASSASGVAGIAALLLPLVRHAVALYFRGESATLAEKLGRGVQLAVLLATTVLVPALGGWSACTAMGAGNLSYLLSATVAEILRKIVHLRTPGIGTHGSVGGLATFGAVYAPVLWGTQRAQGACAPNAGAKAFSRDPATGQITGAIDVRGVLLEATFEAVLKELVKTFTSVAIQRVTDHRRPPQPSSVGASPRHHFAPDSVVTLQCTTLADLWHATLGTSGPNTYRQGTSQAKSAIGSFLREHARTHNWPASYQANLLPLIVTAYESFMHVASLLPSLGGGAGNHQEGLNYDIDATSDGDPDGAQDFAPGSVEPPIVVTRL